MIIVGVVSYKKGQRNALNKAVNSITEYLNTSDHINKLCFPGIEAALTIINRIRENL